MKKYLTILFFILTNISAAQQWDWTIISSRLNNQDTFTYGSGGWDLATDVFGNIYFGGRLSDSIYLVDTILVSNIPESELLVVKFSKFSLKLLSLLDFFLNLNVPHNRIRSI